MTTRKNQAKTKTRTWVFLRGLAREHGHWGDFPEQFKAAFSGDSVMTVDLPGTGDYRGFESPASIAGVCDFVRAKVTERALADDVKGSSYSLLAVSLGGMVAMEWLRQCPHEIETCVLINSSTRFLSPATHRLRWQIWPEFVRIAMTPQIRDREKALVDLLMTSEEAKAKALPLWTRLAQDRPIPYRSFFKQLWAASRYAGLEGPPMNISGLILNSLGDRLVDPSCSEALSVKWKWPMDRHPWAGHDLTWDDPMWTIAKIKAFLMLN